MALPDESSSGRAFILYLLTYEKAEQVMIIIEKSSSVVSFTIGKILTCSLMLPVFPIKRSFIVKYSNFALPLFSITCYFFKTETGCNLTDIA